MQLFRWKVHYSPAMSVNQRVVGVQSAQHVQHNYISSECIYVFGYVLLHSTVYTNSAISISFYFCFQRYIDMRRFQYSSLSLALKTNYTRVKDGSIFSSFQNRFSRQFLKISTLASDPRNFHACFFWQNLHEPTTLCSRKPQPSNLKPK